MIMEQEIWKDIIGYEGQYQISSLGMARSLPRAVSNYTGIVNLKGQLLKPHLRGGYPTYTFCRNDKTRSFAIHRLVAIYFIPNPNNYPEVNHIDGNKMNYSLSNLEWCTRKYNMNHADRTGLRNVKGERSGSAKLNTLQVRLIRRLKGEFTQRDLAKMFGVAHCTIGAIQRNTKWRHIKRMGFSEDRLVPIKMRSEEDDPSGPYAMGPGH